MKSATADRDLGRSAGESTAVSFIAYVYPGWHEDAYRPGIDEWKRLSDFEPYFDGHKAHATPLAGRYDDSEPATAARQLREASRASVAAFSYFTYFADREFVMDLPMRHALAQAGDHGIAISCTWCLRLPHPTLPVEEIEKEVSRRSTDPPVMASIADRAVIDLTIGDAHELLGDDLSAISIRVPHHERPASPQRQPVVAAGSDSAGPLRHWDPSGATGRPEEGRPFPLDEFEELLAALAPGTTTKARSLFTLGPIARYLTVGQMAALAELAAIGPAASIRLSELENALLTVT